MKLKLPSPTPPEEALRILDARRDEMVRRGEIVRLSDAWKKYVANAIALRPSQRSETMRAEIKWAMENDRD